MDEINQKLETLRKLYPLAEDLATFAEIEKNAKLAVLTSNLQNNDAMKQIINMYQKEIATLEKTLLTDKTLFDDEKNHFRGQLTHERINWCRKFLDIFKRADADISYKTKHLDNLLNNENN